MELTKLRFGNGIWEGILTGASETGDAPSISVTHFDQPVEAVDVLPHETTGQWLVRVPVPSHAVAEGVQTFVVFDAATNTKLTDFTLIAGDAASDDMRAEIALLRAELDMLKRAFRRHCLETMV